MNLPIMAIWCLVTAAGLAGCSSSGGSPAAESPTPQATSVTSSGSTAATVGCPLNAAALSAALTTTVVEVSVNALQVPALCSFQESSDPGFTIQISAFPSTTGREKNRSLAALNDDLKAAVDESRKIGLTFRIAEHPEWGTDAFSVLQFNSGKANSAQVWTRKYSSVISDDAGQTSESEYLADARNVGDALVSASK